MISIHSYLRTPDGRFELVETCATPPADPDYIEGAIELTIDGTEIVGKAQWDYVDQLWSYIATMTKKLSSENDISTYFPDQPVLLAFSRKGNRVIVSCESSSGIRRGNIDVTELRGALQAAGTHFFGKMSELVPSNLGGYRIALSNLSD